MEHLELSQRHRDAMLDLVLTWATIDGCLSMLLANVRDIPWYDAADEIRKMRGSQKLFEVIKALQSLPDGKNAANKLKKIKKKYETHSKLRDHVAHSRCIGLDSDQLDVIVFLTFERVAEDQLAQYKIPLEDFLRANDWGKAFVNLLFKLIHPKKNASKTMKID